MFIASPLGSAGLRLSNCHPKGDKFKIFQTERKWNLLRLLLGAQLFPQHASTPDSFRVRLAQLVLLSVLILEFIEPGVVSLFLAIVADVLHVLLPHLVCLGGVLFLPEYDSKYQTWNFTEKTSGIGFIRLPFERKRNSLGGEDASWLTCKTEESVRMIHCWEKLSSVKYDKNGCINGIKKNYHFEDCCHPWTMKLEVSAWEKAWNKIRKRKMWIKGACDKVSWLPSINGINSWHQRKNGRYDLKSKHSAENQRLKKHNLILN